MSACAQTLKISHRANLVIYALTAHGQSCSSDRHSQTSSSRNKKCQLTLGKVTVGKRFGQERSGWSSTLVNVCTRVNATTKTCVWWKWQVSQRCERQQVITEFLSRVKKLHTHFLRGAGGKCPVNARRRPDTALENSAGICSVKGLRGARWGPDRLFVSWGITY